MTAEKLQKLWNLATRNPNENEALVAAKKFIRAINKEQVNVYLYKGTAPASQEQIQKAINNAYQKGINDVKKQYQSELNRHLNTKYNEGYRDGQSNSYTKNDLDKYYWKGFREGKKSTAIQKSEISQITQKEYTSNDIFVNTHGTLGTGTVTFHNGSSEVTIRRN